MCRPSTEERPPCILSPRLLLALERIQTQANDKQKTPATAPELLNFPDCWHHFLYLYILACLSKPAPLGPAPAAASKCLLIPDALRNCWGSRDQSLPISSQNGVQLKERGPSEGGTENGAQNSLKPNFFKGSLGFSHGISTNQPTNQPTNQSTKQPINKPGECATGIPRQIKKSSQLAGLWQRALSLS